MGGVKYKVVPLDESDIADILARLEKKRISKGGNPDESPLGKKTGRAMKAKQDEVRKKAGDEIQTYSDSSILDFTEINPFGEV